MKNLKVDDFVSTQSVFGEYKPFLVKELCEKKVTLENFNGEEQVVSREALTLFYNKVTDNEKMFVDTHCLRCIIVYNGVGIRKISCGNSFINTDDFFRDIIGTH